EVEGAKRHPPPANLPGVHGRRATIRPDERPLPCRRRGIAANRGLLEGLRGHPHREARGGGDPPARRRLCSRRRRRSARGPRRPDAESPRQRKPRPDPEAPRESLITNASNERVAAVEPTHRGGTERRVDGI